MLKIELVSKLGGCIIYWAEKAFGGLKVLNAEETMTLEESCLSESCVTKS